MIPPHLFYQIYLSFLEQNDCTPPKCGELSEYTDSAHTEVEDLSSRCMNGSNVYDRCGHDTRLLHPCIFVCVCVFEIKTKHNTDHYTYPLSSHCNNYNDTPMCLGCRLDRSLSTEVLQKYIYLGIR